MKKENRILICGILPPPSFGHSKMYEMLMQSGFPKEFDVTFLNMRFWSYGKHGKITLLKLGKLVYYYSKFIYLLIIKRPRYVLYNISFDKMPLLKDALFCFTGKLFGCRIIIHDMGQYLKDLYDQCGGFFQWIIKKLLKMSTASIVLGEVTRNVYDDFMEKGRVFSVHGSVEDTYDFDIEGHKENDGKIRVLYFSFLSVSKGLWTALKAVLLVKDQNPDIHFTFAGPIESETLKKQMDAFIAENKLERQVTYVGYVQNAQKRTELLRSSDIFIFPTHRDVFGLVLLHAMAEGLPVIASIEGAIPEIIEDGQNGFLFKKEQSDQLAEKILLLAGDVDLRTKMAKENRKRYLEYYTPQKYGERMIETFRKIMALE